MQDYTDKLLWSKELAERIKRDYNPYAVLVGFTSGGDSNVALKLATMFFKVDAAFTCNTTIAAIETLQNCEKVVTETYGLKHICRMPPYDGLKQDPDTYFKLCKRHGFPGPTETSHKHTYWWLKDHTVSAIVSIFRQKKRNRTIVIVCGARKYESVRRMGNSKDINIVGNTIWVNICNEWTDSETHAFSVDNKIDALRSPVSQIMGMSGECFCGCFAPKGELGELKFASPTTHEKIQFIKKWLWENSKHLWGWGERKPKNIKQEAMGQFNMFSPQMMFCSTCMNNSEPEIS